MKKLFASLVLLFFLSTNSCYAFSELYYFKNIKTAAIEPLVNMSLESQNYEIVKSNPYYAVSSDGNNHAIIILQQSGDNMFYYYEADKNTKINKKILKEGKRQNIVCEQSFNKSIISIYDGLAESLTANSGKEKTYSFDEPEETFFKPVEEPKYKKSQALTGYIAQLSAGTTIPVYLQSSINTATATKGDNITAVISDNVLYNGSVVIPQGSLVYGTLTVARHASYGSRNGRVVINFDKIVTPENQVYNISAETIDFTVSNDGKVAESVKNVAVKAAAGAVVGLLLALVTDGNVGRSVAIGAGVGAGTGVATSAVERGVDAEIPSFTEMELTLTSGLSVSVGQ